MYDESSAIIARHGKKEEVWPQPAGKSHPAGSRGTCRLGGRHRFGGPEQCPVVARHSGAHAEADPGCIHGTELSSQFTATIVPYHPHPPRLIHYLVTRCLLCIP